MEFNHINDCWEFIATAKNTDELQDKLDQLPRWSGDWEFIIEKDESDDEYQVIVINSYFDKLSDSWESDSREVDVICEDLEDVDKPWKMY